MTWKSDNKWSCLDQIKNLTLKNVGLLMQLGAVATICYITRVNIKTGHSSPDHIKVPTATPARERTEEFMQHWFLLSLHRIIPCILPVAAATCQNAHFSLPTCTAQPRPGKDFESELHQDHRTLQTGILCHGMGHCSLIVNLYGFYI